MPMMLFKTKGGAAKAPPKAVAKAGPKPAPAMKGKPSPAKKAAAKGDKKNMAVSLSKPPKSKDLSVREISNGYLIRESSYNEKTGDYQSTETYSKEPPKISIT